jgi:membrane peptidoglycan carboxypeptidase
LPARSARGTAAPIRVPTGNLANNVFAWIAAGDNGRVDISWVGTSAHVDAAATCSAGGPDAVNGIWSLYMTQTQNGHSLSGVTFAPPSLAGQHYIHKGTIQTLLGGQCGDRTLGDFFQLRIGRQGEAQLSYADSNNIDEVFAPHAMYVRQTGGPGVYKGREVEGEPILNGGAADPPRSRPAARQEARTSSSTPSRSRAAASGAGGARTQPRHSATASRSPIRAWPRSRPPAPAPPSWERTARSRSTSPRRRSASSPVLRRSTPRSTASPRAP